MRPLAHVAAIALGLVLEVEAHTLALPGIQPPRPGLRAQLRRILVLLMRRPRLLLRVVARALIRGLALALPLPLLPYGGSAVAAVTARSDRRRRLALAAAPVPRELKVPALLAVPVAVPLDFVVRVGPGGHRAGPFGLSIARLATPAAAAVIASVIASVAAAAAAAIVPAPAPVVASATPTAAAAAAIAPTVAPTAAAVAAAAAAVVAALVVLVTGAATALAAVCVPPDGGHDPVFSRSCAARSWSNGCGGNFAPQLWHGLGAPGLTGGILRYPNQDAVGGVFVAVLRARANTAQMRWHQQRAADRLG
jgi:hypothetical protein